MLTIQKREVGNVLNGREGQVPRHRWSYGRLTESQRGGSPVYHLTTPAPIEILQGDILTT
jgi:hypothetical protein